MLSFWPPARERPTVEPPPVRARHVLLVPGYDPDADKRARMLFVREWGRYARRFGLARHDISPLHRRADGLSLDWTVRAAGADWETAATIEVFRWNDIVERDFTRSVPLRVGLLLVGIADSLWSGVMARFFRFNWKFGGVILYPFVMICALLVAAGALGWAAASAVAFVPGLPPSFLPALRWMAGLAAAALLIAAANPLFERWFVWHLLHDWVFNWQHGNGRRPDYEARVDLFADRLVEIAATTTADEVVVFGHSSGSVMAMEIVARALERDEKLGRRRAAVTLVTVGSCLPLVALNPRARRVHAGIRRIAGRDDLLWVEYQAPQDWMNFPGFNPPRDSAGPRGEVDQSSWYNPVIRSARFAEIMDDATYRSILWKPFRMHFQFLMANERPGEYDFFAIACGPVALSWRCLDNIDAAADPRGPDSELSDLSHPAMQRRIHTADLE